MPFKSIRPQNTVLSAIAMACVFAGTFAFAPSSSVLHMSLSAQEVMQPTARDRMITQAVADLMSSRHLSRQKINDEISTRGLEQFLENLDPMKVYFTKSDVEEFHKFDTQLDDMMLKGDVKFAFTVFTRFLQRLDQRVALANEFINAEHDFTVDESMVTDGDILDFPATEEEARERWRKRIKYNILVLKSSKEKEDADYKERLTKRYDSFAKRMKQFDSEEIVEMYITAMTNSFDPHSSFFSSKTYENFIIQMNLELEGIGASLQSEDGLTIVKRIVPGGAAAKHGKLKVEDKIISVGQGTNGEMVDISDMKLDDVVDKIRGDAGTTVRLGVMLAGSTEVKTYAIVREKIELKDSEAQGVVFEHGKKADGSAYKIGVINLPSFYSNMEAARMGIEDFRSSTRDTQKLLDDFTAEGVDAVIVDLRMNGGGSLPESIDCTGLFIDRGPVVQVKDSVGKVSEHDDVRAGMSWDGPLVVMTSKFSASASEILAGAIKDYERGIVVGDTTTHGKGTVQSLINLHRHLTNSPRPNFSLGALKVTMQQFYRPGGRSTQKKGVEADIVLPSISDHMDVSEDDLDFALEFDQVRKADYPTLNMVNPEMLAKLIQNSKERVGSDKEFTEAIADIEKYEEQKQKKSVTLNEAEFLAQREEFNKDEEDKKQMEEQVNPSEEKIKRDYYMDEVLSITVDYIEQLKAKGFAKIDR